MVQSKASDLHLKAQPPATHQQWVAPQSFAYQPKNRLTLWASSSSPALHHPSSSTSLFSLLFWLPIKKIFQTTKNILTGIHHFCYLRTAQILERAGMLISWGLSIGVAGFSGFALWRVISFFELDFLENFSRTNY